MNTIEKLTLAEAIAGEHNRWAEFSQLYSTYRDSNKVLVSLTAALTDMGLLAEFTSRTGPRNGYKNLVD